MRTTEQGLKAFEDDIMKAARLLIGLVKMTEVNERTRSGGASLEVNVELNDGEVETWTITIRRGDADESDATHVWNMDADKS